jgi:hypothetical protein
MARSFTVTMARKGVVNWRGHLFTYGEHEGKCTLGMEQFLLPAGWADFTLTTGGTRRKKW